jgi:luciferase family oxidoreductase group 1
MSDARKVVPLSVLDLAFVGETETVHDGLAGCVRMAQRAEQLGYRRVWYAEHHNTRTIASSAPAVLIAHVAAHTQRIRLGAGGVMLPNHAPLVIAEQFGTLASLHPNRIDLGLGRAPGTDQNTLRALRRSADAAESFPQDVLELQGFLGGDTRIPHVHAIPGRDTNVPLYILGSSLFGAQLAAKLGLPYAFASHFAPQQLQDAVQVYRARFEPSKQLDRPHVIAGINVIAADTEAQAQEQAEWRRRAFARALFRRPGQRLSDDAVELLL